MRSFWSQWKILEIDSFNAVNPKFAPVGEDWRSSYIQQSIQYSGHCECSNQHQTLPVSAKTWNIFIILQAQFKPCIFALWPLHWPGGCQRPSTASLTPSLRPGSSSVWPSKILVRTSFHWRPPAQDPRPVQQGQTVHREGVLPDPQCEAQYYSSSEYHTVRWGQVSAGRGENRSYHVLPIGWRTGGGRRPTRWGKSTQGAASTISSSPVRRTSIWSQVCCRNGFYISKYLYLCFFQTF